MIKLQNTQTGQMPFYQSTTMLQKKISNRFWNRKSEKYFAKYSKTQVYINAQMKELKPLNVSFPHSDGYTSDKLLLWQYIPFGKVLFFHRDCYFTASFHNTPFTYKKQDILIFLISG